MGGSEEIAVRELVRMLRQIGLGVSDLEFGPNPQIKIQDQRGPLSRFGNYLIIF